MANARNPGPARHRILKDDRSKPYPELCRRCAVPERNAAHDRCDFCRDIAFDEGTLCDLTRSVQNPDAFACYAFRPVSGLSLVKNVKDLPDDRKPTAPASDSYKYWHASAVQRVRSDPDGVYLRLAYHFVWNVAKRKPLFSHPADARGLIDGVLSACGDEIGGVASVLWLAPDHIHVYVESDGEKSVDAIVKVARRVSAKALHDLREKGHVWEKAYFAQTIG